METLERLLQFEGLGFSYENEKEKGCTISVRIDSVSQLVLRPENELQTAPVPTDRASQSTTSNRPEEEKADDEESDDRQSLSVDNLKQPQEEKADDEESDAAYKPW